LAWNRTAASSHGPARCKPARGEKREHHRVHYAFLDVHWIVPPVVVTPTLQAEELPNESETVKYVCPADTEVIVSVEPEIEAVATLGVVLLIVHDPV
jgi:hypothetical protein